MRKGCLLDLLDGGNLSTALHFPVRPGEVVHGDASLVYFQVWEAMLRTVNEVQFIYLHSNYPLHLEWSVR
jgi:hypothetical protein